MRKKIVPTICTIGLVLSSIPTEIYALDDIIENNKRENEHDDKINLNEDIIDKVENIDIPENNDEENNLSYVDISDINLIFAINESLNKNELTSKITKEEMASLESIDLSDKNIESLEGIEFAKNLKKIDLSNNYIEDIKQLSSLTALEELNLSNNKIENIEPIKSLVNLKRLDLSNTIRDVSIDGEKLNSDEEIENKGNKIKDVSSLAFLSNLVMLNLSNNKIENIDEIINLRSLKSLNLSGNSITNISSIKNISGIINLNLSNQIIVKDKLNVIGKNLEITYDIKDELNYLINPSFISKNGILENTDIKWENLDEYVSSLEVKFTKDIKINEDLEVYYSGKIIQPIEVDEIVDIEDSILLNTINNSLGKTDLNSNVLKSEIEKIEVLEIKNSELKSLKGLAYAINLRELSIKNTKIENFDELSSLSNLTILNLTNNKVKNIDFLNNMLDLKYLNLEGNNISNANNIKYNLSLLEELNMSNNNLYSIDLKGLNNLCELNLSDNYITRVDGIEDLKKLEVLNLNNNNIGDISTLSTLENLSKVDVENQVVYLPLLSFNQRALNIQNPIVSIDDTIVNPNYISEYGVFEGENIKWDRLNDDINSLSFEFSDTIEKESSEIGGFSGKVIQPLDIELFSTEEYLGLSLSTNQIKFENFTGIEDMEKLGAIEMNVDSDKAYDISVSMPVEIKSIDGTKTVGLGALSIRESTSPTYSQFNNINEKILLIENVASGINTHSFDFRLNKDSFSEKDSYRAVVKFEINQK